MAEKNDSMKNRLKGKFRQIKKPDKERSSVRKDHSKRTAFFVWLLIIGMLFIATVSILLSINTRSTLNETNQSIVARENEEVKEEIPYASANEFLSSFVQEYINVPRESAALDERAKNIKEYMVFNEAFNDDRNPLYNLEGVSGTRTLETFNLFNIEDKGDMSLYQYKVTFKNQVEREVEKEVKKGKKKKVEIETEEEENTLLLNIPIIYENGLFSVSAIPYFTEVPSLAGNIEYEKEKIGLEEYKGSEKENIAVFMNTFFEKYSTESIEEMAYLMEEPKTLNGSFLFEEISDLLIYVDGENYKVFLQVMFRDELTNIQQVNQVEMTISKNGNNFYVEKLNYI
ncbi:conjugal transfer protein [Oceanobacillus profundus]|uniref:conjugal transfer protein n=1 Tax=Oceanobacillus profundus TaxID=372463 RepID=UPI0026E214B4|nr:conjugal transfer protein [Oceanobacillus profundus]MDO6450545.1 conjugal transfer protein [Oceanobacillus profundus]